MTPQPSDCPPDLRAAFVADRAQLQIPSQTDWIPPTLDFLRERLLRVGACDEIQAQRLLLGLHEGLTNAIVHGNLEVPSALKEEGDAFAHLLAERQADPHYSGRTVAVGLDYDAGCCRWTITDEGPGFDVEAVLHRVEDPENVFLASGRGILMMRAFFDEVRWELGGRRLVLAWAAPHAQEQHRHPRRPLHGTVQVAPIRADGSVDWAAATEAVMRNLSAGGASLLQRALARADRVMLALDVDGQPLYVPAQVRHCTTLPDGLVELGCCFQVEAPEEAPAADRVQHAIEALLAEAALQKSPTDNRRRHEHVLYAARVELLATADQPAVTGFAQDLSRGGLKFITTQEVPCEVRTLVLPRPSGPLRVRVEVLRCVRVTDHFHDVAVRFLDTE